MTVREFIEWLKTVDQEATVQVIEWTEKQSCGECYIYTTETDFVPELSEYIDFKNNPYITEDKS